MTVEKTKKGEATKFDRKLQNCTTRASYLADELTTGNSIHLILSHHQYGHKQGASGLKLSEAGSQKTEQAIAAFAGKASSNMKQLNPVLSFASHVEHADAIDSVAHASALGYKKWRSVPWVVSKIKITWRGMWGSKQQQSLSI